MAKENGDPLPAWLAECRDGVNADGRRFASARVFGPFAGPAAHAVAHSAGEPRRAPQFPELPQVAAGRLTLATTTSGAVRRSSGNPPQTHE